MNRRLAHSLRDEIPAPRPPIEPIVVGWRDVASLTIAVVVIGAGGWAFLILLASMGPR